jgi:hypothetical protein
MVRILTCTTLELSKAACGPCASYTRIGHFYWMPSCLMNDSTKGRSLPRRRNLSKLSLPITHRKRYYLSPPHTFMENDSNNMKFCNNLTTMRWKSIKIHLIFMLRQRAHLAIKRSWVFIIEYRIKINFHPMTWQSLIVFNYKAVLKDILVNLFISSVKMAPPHLPPLNFDLTFSGNEGKDVQHRQWLLTLQSEQNACESPPTHQALLFLH